MIETLRFIFSEPVWWSYALRAIIAYLTAWAVHRFSKQIARLLYRGRFSLEQRNAKPERVATLRGLLASAITFFAFLTATLLSLSMAVDTDTLIWIVGLFSAAFGLGARPLISDFLTGVGFLFEDTFDVGEKVEMLGIGIEGMIEAVNLRTTLVRASSGELFTVPNGEIRAVRNYSRGHFSIADIKIKIATTDLSQALSLLKILGIEAVTLLPNLLEPWQIISPSGEMGQQTELTLITKARFGKAADMRPRLLTLVQERLDKANITLSG